MRVLAFFALAVAGCSQQTTTSPAAAIAVPPPQSIVDLPTTITVQQRSTTPVPGSKTELLLTIDDITRGQVMVTLLATGEGNLLGPVSMKHGDVSTFHFGASDYSLTLTDLNNEAIGDDSATLVVAEADSALLAESQKIEALIATVESLTGAVFIRNGDEHSPQEAADHLRQKLSAAGTTVTAEHFIDKVASKSSLTGEDYQIRFEDGRIVSAGKFLREELAQLEERITSKTAGSGN